MKVRTVVMAAALVSFVALGQGAYAKGALRGAAKGAVVGHVLGHHGKAGAAIGAVHGHHHARMKAAGKT